LKFRIADFQINIARGWLSRLVWGTNVQFVSANHMLDTDRREPRCSFEPISVEPQVLDRLIYPVPRSRRQQGRAHCFSLGRLEYLQSRRPSIIGLPTRLISTWGHFRLADCVHLDRQKSRPSEARVCCPAVCDGRRLWPGAVSGFLSTRDKESCPITSSPPANASAPCAGEARATVVYPDAGMPAVRSPATNRSRNELSLQKKRSWRGNSQV
jgi:hypothetical protein